MEETAIINFDDRTQKQRFLSRAGALTGSQQITIKRWKPRRSNRANAFYHAAVVTTFRQYLRDQGESFTHEECHELIKTKILGTRTICNLDGEIVGEIPKPSSTLSTAEFAEFVQLAIAWLHDMFGIIVMDQNFAPPAKADRANYAGSVPRN